MNGRDRLFHLERVLLHLHSRGDVSSEQKAALVDAVNHIAWDDAVHIAAPWEPRSSLCGNWFRNLVALGDPRPDGMAGCWTCLMAADWFDKQKGSALPPVSPVRVPPALQREGAA